MNEPVSNNGKYYFEDSEICHLSRRDPGSRVHTTKDFVFPNDDFMKDLPRRVSKRLLSSGILLIFPVYYFKLLKRFIRKTSLFCLLCGSNVLGMIRSGG